MQWQRLLLIFGLMLMVVQFASGQPDDLIQVMDEAVILSNLAWSSDGQKLVFQDNCCGDVGTTSEGQHWYAYDVTTNRLTESNHWQLDTQLTKSERNFADIWSRDFSYISPDERYVLFSANTHYTAQLRLYDRQQEQFVNLPFINVSRLTGSDRFSAWWNEDSTAFITRLSENTAYEVIIGYAYVHNYNPILDNAEFIPLFYDVEIEGDKHLLIRPYDVSSDGSIVLLEIFNTTGRGSNIGFYDPITPENTFFVPRSVTGAETVEAAQFLEGDSNKIIYVNRSGIYIYDKSIGTAELIRDDIKSRDYNRSLFSPGGEHLALAKNGHVYVLDLRHELSEYIEE